MSGLLSHDLLVISQKAKGLEMTGRVPWSGGK